MSNNNKAKDIIKKLVTKYENTSWNDTLPVILNSVEFEVALNQLVSDHKEGKAFNPPIKDIFKSFDLCPLEDVKVVFVTDYPIKDDSYTGLAFSELKENVFKQQLKSLVLNQLPEQEGVLLLNTSLTAPKEPNNAEHSTMWKPVINQILETVSNNIERPLIFVFVGSNVEYLKDFLNEKEYKFFLPDLNDQWDPVNAFENINSLLNNIKNLSSNDKNFVSW